MDVDLLELGNIECLDDKHTIIVEYEQKETLVSWYKGLNTNDIEEAILCACDSIIDQGFVLNDFNGFPVPVGQVVPGEKYYIVPGDEIKGKEKILGERLRRITVEIPPLTHIESIKALEVMKNGANILKHTRNSMPHIRLFQITNDIKYLIWYSAGKSQENSSILLENIFEVKLGQATQTFLCYPIPSLEHLSFSIVHSNGTLDLTCRDEREYDIWVIGFKSILFYYKQLNVSKKVLLSHSRRFIEYLKQNKISLATSSIYQDPETKKLEECIIRKTLTRQDISSKLLKIHSKLSLLAEKILDLPSDTTLHNTGKQSKDQYGGEYYEIFLEDTSTEEIYHTEQQRMVELNDQCRSKLFELETEFSNKHGVPEHHDTSAFEIELWRLEVDVENLNDIIGRIQRTTDPKWSNKLKSWFKDFF